MQRPALIGMHGAVPSPHPPTWIPVMNPRQLSCAVFAAALALTGLLAIAPQARSQIDAAPSWTPIGSSASGSGSMVWFHEHLVAIYCPRVFFEGGRNLTPDKLPAAERRALLAACDAHLRTLVDALAPAFFVFVILAE